MALNRYILIVREGTQHATINGPRHTKKIIKKVIYKLNSCAARQSCIVSRSDQENLILGHSAGKCREIVIASSSSAPSGRGEYLLARSTRA